MVQTNKNKPSKPGHVWVEDKSVKTGGYFRKLPPGAKVAPESKDGEGPKGDLKGVLAKVALGVGGVLVGGYIVKKTGEAVNDAVIKASIKEAYESGEFNNGEFNDLKRLMADFSPGYEKEMNKWQRRDSDRNDDAGNNRPTKAGHTWVEDRTVKGGGYFRKLASDKKAKAIVGNNAEVSENLKKAVGSGLAATAAGLLAASALRGANPKRDNPNIREVDIGEIALNTARAGVVGGAGVLAVKGAQGVLEEYRRKREGYARASNPNFFWEEPEPWSPKSGEGVFETADVNAKTMGWTNRPIPNAPKSKNLLPSAEERKAVVNATKRNKKKDNSDRSDADPRRNVPTKAGHTWVEDKSVKAGGYFRKLPPGAKASGGGKPSSGAGNAILGGGLTALAAAGLAAAAANRKPEGVLPGGIVLTGQEKLPTAAGGAAGLGTVYLSLEAAKGYVRSRIKTVGESIENAMANDDLFDNLFDDIDFDYGSPEDKAARKEARAKEKKNRPGKPDVSLYDPDVATVDLTPDIAEQNKKVPRESAEERKQKQEKEWQERVQKMKDELAAYDANLDELRKKEEASKRGRKMKEDSSDRNDRAERTGVPTKPGHTWVEDRTVKGGGYFRKLAAGETAKGSKPPQSAGVGGGVGVVAKVGLGSLVALAATRLAASAATQQQKQEGQDKIAQNATGVLTWTALAGASVAAGKGVEAGMRKSANSDIDRKVEEFNKREAAREKAEADEAKKNQENLAAKAIAKQEASVGAVLTKEQQELQARLARYGEGAGEYIKEQDARLAARKAQEPPTKPKPRKTRDELRDEAREQNFMGTLRAARNARTKEAQTVLNTLWDDEEPAGLSDEAKAARVEIRAASRKLEEVMESNRQVQVKRERDALWKDTPGPSKGQPKSVIPPAPQRALPPARDRGQPEPINTNSPKGAKLTEELEKYNAARKAQGKIKQNAFEALASNPARQERMKKLKDELTSPPSEEALAAERKYNEEIAAQPDRSGQETGILGKKQRKGSMFGGITTRQRSARVSKLKDMFT